MLSICSVKCYRQHYAAGVRRGAADARPYQICLKIGAYGSNARPYWGGFPGADAPSVGTEKTVYVKSDSRQ
jgi:hypothetical protein